MKDEEKAIKIFEKGKENNDSNSIYYLGTIYDLKNDMKKAKENYEIAANLGSISALTNLGSIIENEDESEKIYLQSAEKREAMAMKNLVIFYYEKENFEKSEIWAKKILEEPNLVNLNSELKENAIIIIEMIKNK